MFQSGANLRRVMLQVYLEARPQTMQVHPSNQYLNREAMYLNVAKRLVLFEDVRSDMSVCSRASARIGHLSGTVLTSDIEALFSLSCPTPLMLYRY